MIPHVEHGCLSPPVAPWKVDRPEAWTHVSQCGRSRRDVCHVPAACPARACPNWWLRPEVRRTFPRRRVDGPPGRRGRSVGSGATSSPRGEQWSDTGSYLDRGGRRKAPPGRRRPRRTSGVTTNGASLQPNEACGPPPVGGHAHAGTRGETGRPPPPAAPKLCGRKLKAFHLVRCGFRSAVEQARSTLHR